jgi:hypothetical protein
MAKQIQGVPVFNVSLWRRNLLLNNPFYPEHYFRVKRNINLLSTDRVSNPHLYKYIPKQFGDLMISEGKIRIGTLYQYKKMEGRESGDRFEGDGLAYFDSHGSYGQGDLPQLFGGGIELLDGAKITLAGDAKFVTHVSVPDVYIYCVTTRPDEGIMKEFKCDSCIEIRSVTKFALEIGEVLYDLGLTWSPYPMIRYCDYGERQRRMMDFQDTLSIYWMKTLNYFHQSEVRFVFHPKLKIAGPVDIEVPAIRSLIRKLW